MAVFKFGGLVPKQAQEILNLAVWPQIEHKKYWQNLNLAVVPCSVLHHHKHCARVCVSGSVAILSLEVLEKSLEFANLQKNNW